MITEPKDIKKNLDIFKELDFTEYGKMWRKDMPTDGVYILIDVYGWTWIEYDLDGIKNSVGVGKYSAEQIKILVNTMSAPVEC